MDKALGDKSWAESPLPLAWWACARRLGRGVAFPFARWYAHVRHMATLLHPPVQLTSPMTYGQNTTSRALHVAPKPLLPHCTLSAHARHATLCRAAAQTHPLHSCA
jgi:hypothetical protein